MAGPRQPTNLLMLKGKKHFTKAELEERLKKEVVAPANNIAPPTYLTKTQKQKFIDIACDLLDIGIMANLDCDALARYIQSEDKYLEYNKLVNKTLRAGIGDTQAVIMLEKLEGLRDKALKQCRSSAADLGLTISSRCKIVVPKGKAPEDKNARMFGDGVG